MTTERVIAHIEVLTGLGIALFWVLFFTVGMAPANAPPAYFAFEYSFVLSDFLLAVGLLVAGTLVLYERGWGHALSLVCAGSLIFLGLVDFGFNIRNDIYTTNLTDGIIAGVINLWCVALGICITAAFGPVQSNRD